MDAKRCLHLGIFLYLAIISEARVIVPRNIDDEIPFSINPFGKDNRLGLKPAVWGPPIGDSEYSDNSGIIDPARPPLINDYEYEPGRNVDKEDNRPGTNPERFPTNADREKRPDEAPEEKDEIDNSGDDNFINEHDVGDPGKFGNDDKDFKLSPDEDKPINKEGDESEVENTGPEESEEEINDKENKPEDEDEEKPDEEKDEDEPVEDDNNEKYNPEVEEQPDEDEEKPDEKEDEDEPVEDGNDEKHNPEVEEQPGEEESKDDTNDKEDKPEDEEKPDEEREEDEKYEPENDDGKKYIPEEESTDDEKKEAGEGSEDDKNGDESIFQEGEQGLFSGGSIFDTPFFNLEQVKNYFSKLDRALSHVFRQTLDEALLLNGTYANTTEEEVDIGGKKYIVTKSVLKGADNNSMMYVEALSTKPKVGDIEVVKDTDVKNATSA